MAQQITINFDWKRVIPIIAALLVGFGIGVWQPWGSDERTIQVTGDATVQAEPDEYVFYPSYTAEAATSSEAITEVTTTGNAVVEKIKSFGVPDNKIRTDISSNQYFYRPDGTESDEYQAYFSITITVGEKVVAQSIQDYLLTTENRGSSTPQSDFTEAKRKELKNQARKLAVENAKQQGQQIADELGDKLGEVKSIEEVSGFDVFPIYGGKGGDIAVTDSSAISSPILTGEQELIFSVRVIFEIR